MNRTGKVNYGKWAFGLLLVLIVGFALTKYEILNTDKILPADTTGASTSEKEAAILAQIQPSITATARDVYNDSVTGGPTTLYVNGIKSTGTAGTASNVAAGSQFEVLFDDVSHYYGRVTGKAPLNGNTPVEIPLYANGTLSSTFKNSAGTASTAQAIGAGGEETVSVQFQVGNDKVFSNPLATENPIICFDYNTTAISRIEVVGGSKTAMPQQAVGTYEECWTSTFHSLADNAKKEEQFLVVAKANSDPTTDATAVVYDQDLYIASSGASVGQRLFGVEDNLGTDIGGVNPTATLDFS